MAEIVSAEVWGQLLERCGKSLLLWNADGELAWLSVKARHQLEAAECQSSVERASRLALSQLQRKDDRTHDSLLGRPRQVGSVAGAALFVEFSRLAGPDGRSWLVAELEEREGTSGDLARLSAAEARVLRLLVRGLSNREIGIELSVSNETVKTHVKHVLSRLGVSSRAKAASVARATWDDVSVPSHDRVEFDRAQSSRSRNLPSNLPMYVRSRPEIRAASD